MSESNDAVTVAIRVRPLTSAEASQGLDSCIVARPGSGEADRSMKPRIVDDNMVCFVVNKKFLP